MAPMHYKCHSPQIPDSIGDWILFVYAARAHFQVLKTRMGVGINFSYLNPMKLSILPLLILLISAHSQAQNKDERIVIVQKYLDAAFKKDIDTQRLLLDDHVIDYHPTVLASPSRGKNELLMGWNNMMQPLDSISYERTGTGLVDLQDGDFSGEWVLETGLVHMKPTGSNEWIKVQMIGIYLVENRKIREVRNFGNMLDLYQQMGYSLTPPGK
jgi:hypothetical protein